MSGTEITVTMVGADESHGRVRFDDFFRFCETVFKCLRVSEQLVSGETAAIEYRISGLKYGSATVKLEAVQKIGNKGDDRRSKVVTFFRTTVADLQKGKVDPRIPPEGLGVFRELANPLKHGTKRVVIGRVSITTKFDKAIARILDENISSEGSVSGILERVNVHEDRNEFVIYPQDETTPITCSFPESLLDNVRKALKKNVTISGTQTYRPGCALPSRVHAKEIEIHPADSDLPSLHDVRALGKWDTGGLNSVEFLRAIRNEQA